MALWVGIRDSFAHPVLWLPGQFAAKLAVRSRERILSQGATLRGASPLLFPVTLETRP